MKVLSRVEKVMLVKPQTYMNNLGESLREIVEYYRLELSRLVVIYDDIDLDLGTIRIRPGEVPVPIMVCAPFSITL